MKSKIALAVSAALLSMGVNAGTSTQGIPQASVSKPQVAPKQITKIDSKQQEAAVVSATQAVFAPEKDLAAGKYRYFVRLSESPVALYEGGIDGYKATSPQIVKSKSRKLDVKSSEVKSYRSFLNKQQDTLIAKARTELGELKVIQRTTLAYNGMVVEMTQDEAAKLAKIPGIAHIKRETLRYTQTDAGPAIIKAPTVWTGSATGVKSQGEGMIVGIIDTGINTDHPSFADVGGDGYDHTNPWGANNYSGDCKVDFPELCNDKLIGVHSWPAITEAYLDYDVTVPANGEDHNGHGSHTAGTTAGNVLINQAVVDAEGGNTDVIFEKISGVAPHANIVSYQVCLPGENDEINFRGCLPSLTVLAVEHAIENGIDAINYSIGGGSSNPWNDADALAFLAARKAGIHVATSAGNSGPGPQTVGSPGDAPWITTVAAYTHDRDFSDKTLSGFTGGDTEAPAEITGKSISGAFAGKIVYAGDFENPNDPEGDPAQCLKKFPENTFAVDTIVVCDRGEIARTKKGTNVKAGGAAGLVLANVSGGASSVAADAHVLPAINIDAAQGNALRAWLASGTGHTASISATEIVHDEAFARIAAEFTSRGPNKSVPNVIVPSIAAPGVSIYAAYADSQSDGFKSDPDPRNFAFLDGTSMASPHVAGALTLLASIHPSWSPAEVQSALMMTANQNTFKEDGKTPSDFFDMGAGFANIEAAAKTGLVMNETFAGYMKADPGVGGKPENINLPTMANAKCVDTCTWTRVVKATAAGSWTAAAAGNEDGFGLTVSPASFTLAKGETKVLTITADVSAADAGWHFANIKLTATGLPEVKLPVAVKADGNNLPDTLSFTAGRNTGSMTFAGFAVKGETDISMSVYDKATALIAPETLHVPDGGLDYTVFTLGEALPNIKFSISSKTAPDVDLRILNSSFKKIGSSAGPDSNESVSFTNFAAGTYYVVVDGYTASAPGAVDDVEVEVTSVLFNNASLSDVVSTQVSESNGETSVTFLWNTDKDAEGILAVQSNDGDLIKQIAFEMTREDDINLVSNLADAMVAGEASRISFDIAPNLTSEDKVYELEAVLSKGHEVANIGNGGTVSGTTVSWTVTQAAGSAEMMSVGFDLIPRKSGEFFGVKLTSELDGDEVTETRKFGVAQVAPVAAITAPAKAKEETSVSISGNGSSDANNDSLTYAWVQTAGTAVSFDAKAADISFTTPKVGASGETLSFALTVSDGKGNSDTKSVDVAVENVPPGGALGWMSLIMLPLVWLRRKVK